MTSASSDIPTQAQGIITAAYGRHYEVETTDGAFWHAVPLGKRSHFACGDHVQLQLACGGQARLIEHLPRTSLLFRSDAWKQKLIAANVTQIIFVVAITPAFSDELISRALVAAVDQNLRVVILLSKCDLAPSMAAQNAAARAQLAPFLALGYPIIELSALQNAAPVLPWLIDQSSILVGQSGMGKSTLINTLIPEAASSTREISTALDSGKHTTTHASLYRLPQLTAASTIIDSPGLQAFGLAHLSEGAIDQGFVEFRQTLGRCRFSDCHHDKEPGCAVKALVEAGTIHPRRYAHYLAICSEAK